MKRFASVLGLAVCLSLVAGAGTEWASWTTTGTGSGTSRAIALPTGPTPIVSVTGRNVVVSWSQVNLPDATPVTAYQVGRFSTANVAQTIGSTCSGTVNALTCTETAVPAGTWRYTYLGQALAVGRHAGQLQQQRGRGRTLPELLVLDDDQHARRDPQRHDRRLRHRRDDHVPAG